jgi:hypothetical protein
MTKLERAHAFAAQCLVAVHGRIEQLRKLGEHTTADAAMRALVPMWNDRMVSDDISWLDIWENRQQLPA